MKFYELVKERKTLNAIRDAVDEIEVEQRLELVYTPEEHFRCAVRTVLSYGVFPGPSIMNLLVGLQSTNNLNSKRTKWRNDELLKAGFTKGLGRYDHWRKG